MKFIQKHTLYFFIAFPIVSCIPNLSPDLANIAYLSYLLRVPTSVSSSSSAPLTQTAIPGSITLTPTAGLITTESGLTASFTVVLDSLPTANVVIPISSSNTAEGTVSITSLTFTPANYNTPQTVFVNGVNDAIADGSISYKILTGNAISTDANYNGLDPSDVDVINADNDSIGITVSAISGNTNESGLTASFTVRLNSAPTANVTIPISSSNTAEGTVSTAILTFTPANYNTPQTVFVNGVDDSVADGNINYNIVIGNSTSGDASYHGLNPADLTLTNMDVGEKRTFISSSTLNGNLGGIAGADALCNSDGAKPSILPNTYKAMIVDGTNRKASNTANAGDGQVDWVFLPNTSYFRTDGTTLIKTTNANSIFVFPLTNSFDTPGIPYWTGLNTDWTTSSNRCATDWTSTTGNGQAGQATMLTVASISGGGPPPCNAALPRLLCVQQ
ncbi:MAG: DUF1554 domain-containing protein [Leptospiraceae bacterium]|nr:DUF1554 domain-containing protein [Leptospiraceae bacterium]MBP9164722.1 DUF1554 domain-containing protein [Leptospiraceae bacterium]